MNKVAIVIPIYKPILNQHEEIALKQCLKVFFGYPIIVIKPFFLELPTISEHLTESVSFEDKYFESKRGYNELMLSKQFYEAFLNYQYILIYQLDAFAFRNELPYWCSLNYDYIGAPWLYKLYPNIFKELFARVRSRFHIFFDILQNDSPLPTNRQLENRTGNGGLSLRKVSKFYKLTQLLKADIDKYNSKTDYLYHEDLFWSIAANRTGKRLKIPGYKKALEFSFEINPQLALKVTRNKLPFGCHAWNLDLEFWRPIFRRYGYDI